MKNMKNILNKNVLRLNINKNLRFFSTEQSVQPWVGVENKLAKLRSELVLTEHSQIENYVVNLVRGYYRTTNKDAVTKDSVLEDHGLDSVDSLELCVNLEDELGYIIEAETMTKFSKVSHFINYILHLEAYKREFKVLPQTASQESTENWDDFVPQGEALKNKLYGYTKEGKKDGEKH